MTDDYNLPNSLIKYNRVRHGTYSWRAQALQYDQFGPPDGIVYHRFMDGSPIDTLLCYDEDGYLAGILNTYPVGHFDGEEWIEQPGNINTFVRPNTTGVNEKLTAEASRRWPAAKEAIAFWEAHRLGYLPDGGHRIPGLRP